MEHICCLVLLTAILTQSGCSAPTRLPEQNTLQTHQTRKTSPPPRRHGATRVFRRADPVVTARAELAVALGDGGAGLLHRQRCPASPRQVFPLHRAPHLRNALRRSWQPLNWKEKGLIISSTTSAVTRTSDPFPVTLHLLWMFYTEKGQSLHN